jgi:Pyruvate/2-oxoacid:ferredoxin oxidoreductase delta subunit
MGHIINAKEEVYQVLAERLSKTPEGALINEEFMNLLHRLYTESEALVGGKFPSIPIPLNRIANFTGLEETELKVILDDMSNKGLVIDIPRRNSFYYMLAPMVVGFFEYTFMRVRDQADLKELAELFEKYFQSDGVTREIFGIDTKVMRSLIYENVIPVAVETEVLEYEKASEIIRQSGGGSISLCACRHEASHRGKACDAPMEVCMTFGGAAEWIIRKGMGKAATVEDLLHVLAETRRLGLVHLCDNILNQPTYICSCCGCCCHVLRSINEQGVFGAHPSNFIPAVELDNCLNCGVCADKCQIGAITMTKQKNELEIPVINTEHCLGCGVCTYACPNDTLYMFRRSVLHVPPKNYREKMQRMTEEKVSHF